MWKWEERVEKKTPKAHPWKGTNQRMLQAKKMMEGWGADAKEIAQKGSLNLTFDCIYLKFVGDGGLGQSKQNPAFCPFGKVKGMRKRGAEKRHSGFVWRSKQYD